MFTIFDFTFHLSSSPFLSFSLRWILLIDKKQEKEKEKEKYKGRSDINDIQDTQAVSGILIIPITPILSDVESDSRDVQVSHDN